MLESLINPKKIERGSIKMLFIGLLYGSLSLLLVKYFFGGDPVLSKASGMIVITFCVMFTLPYLYFMFRQEEQEDESVEGFFGVWKVHKDAVWAFMWLFVGLLIAFVFWNIILHDSNLFNFQIQTYCLINNQGNIDECISQYSFAQPSVPTGALTKKVRLLSIIENNVYVMIFTLIFSLIFGAGAVFVLAWNASVIAAAVGIFTKYQIADLPLGIARYMIHGIPEIASYFLAALAGGIVGVGVLRHKIKSKKFLRILENAVLILFVALIIIFIAGLIEVYITPNLFK